MTAMSLVSAFFKEGLLFTSVFTSRTCPFVVRLLQAEVRKRRVLAQIKIGISPEGRTTNWLGAQRFARGRSLTRITNFSPDQTSFTAQTVTSTSPASRPVSRTT